MDRRVFLKSTAAAAAVLPWQRLAAASEWRSYEVTTRIEILNPEGRSLAWVPLPLIEDTAWQRNLGSQWSGNAARASFSSRTLTVKLVGPKIANVTLSIPAGSIGWVAVHGP